MKKKAICVFNASRPGVTGWENWTGQMPFLEYEDCEREWNAYKSNGFTVSKIYAEIRLVDTVSGVIGPVPA